MEITYSYTTHINGVSDLQTHYEDYRAGFLEIAFQKNLKSTPFIEEARSLKVMIQAAGVKTPAELLNYDELRAPMLTASGISDKAKKFLNEEDQKTAIKNLITDFLEPAGTGFIDELVYRYLLIKGDAFGGVMRNLVGNLAERKLVLSLISSLNIAEIPYIWLDKRDQKWVDPIEDLSEMSENCKGIYWSKNGVDRTFWLNLNIKKVNKNIDLCIFNGSPKDFSKKDFVENEELAVAFGELKGGIDPAGADEHWKTANTALSRIRQSYNPIKNIQTFFIGAAIEASMASEIFEQLNQSTLNNAANSTKPDQISSISNWIVNI
ncbi:MULTISPECIES: AvaI/BsoBI family type II restriction endonuclease [Enterococcus]|uniref:AvaI/BsoBI family type II restriction endonuclease n=1 Tax=Enterococcus TaxID=1350 RepID=UPI00115C4F72|nr:MULTISPECIES: AvaI/BsoBI family type II restriction endonuclease [Enterococcus]MDT0254513.1 AvaI/BsoBI family type II restriction endonuclease [Enterococcus faecium]NTN69175.1 restriction endonuclease [Enterococcus faecium]HDL0813527.1 hypothetical protein [Enterococcus faecium]